MYNIWYYYLGNVILRESCIVKLGSKAPGEPSGSFSLFPIASFAQTVNTM